MRKWTLAIAAGAALALSACGGGGGGTASTEQAPAGAQPGAPGPAATAGTAATTGTPARPASVRVQGRVRFESIPVRAGVGLDPGGRSLKPARGLTLEWVDTAGRSLAKTRTDAAGAYAVTLPARASAVLQIYASMVQSEGTAGRWQVEVLDNTAQGALWGVKSAPLPIGNGDQTVDTVIPAGWMTRPDGGSAVVAALRLAAPFAILDTVYENQARVLAATPGTVFPPLAVLWSPANRPSTRVDPATGEFLGTAFQPLETIGVMVLMGRQGVDTDEYDGTVISHEWGHYFQRAFGRDDSVGGSHRSGDLLDRSVAFSEGFSTAWSGIALGQDEYVDSFGERQGDTVTIALGTPPTQDAGWFNEHSVRYLLWKLQARFGAGPLLQAMRGPLRTGAAATGIHAFHAALKLVSPVAAEVLAALLPAQGIQPGADAWGVGETNHGGSTVALPMARPLLPGVPLPGVCVSNALDPRREHNKLGEIAYLRLSVATAGSYRVTVSGPQASDPDLRIGDGSGTVALAVDAAPAVQAASAQLAAGDYLLAVRDKNLSSDSTCFTVAIQ